MRCARRIAPPLPASGRRHLPCRGGMFGQNRFFPAVASAVSGSDSLQMRSADVILCTRPGGRKFKRTSVGLLGKMRSWRTAILPALLLGALSPQVSSAQASRTMSDANVRDRIAKLYDASREGKGLESFRQLRELLDAGRLQDVPPYVIATAIWAIRQKHEEEFLEFSFDITASERFVLLDAEIQPWFAAPALLRAATNGDEGRAESLLPYLEQPGTFINLLSNREYEPIWPLIERYAGDHLSNVSGRYVEWSERRLSEKPGDLSRFTDLVRSLHYAGRFEEVVSLMNRWRQSRNGAAVTQEDAGWAMNIEAYALDALGRVEEADGIFDQLADLSPNQHPWMVNFAINRASRLVAQERWEEGLAATERARWATRNEGTVYAKMLIARDRTCALHRLGRPQEAKPELEYLRQNFDQARLEATTGLLCAGLDDEAYSKIAGAFADGRSTVFVDTLQGAGFELFYTPSRLPSIGEFILSRPELRDAAFRHVRLIPERFVPAAHLRRQDVQIAAGAGPSS
jgi:tetratricopeptide (TPR) repeat protein